MLHFSSENFLTMLTDIIETLADLERVDISFPEMLALVATKKARRSEKGSTAFNCIVLDCEKKAPDSCLDFFNIIQSISDTPSGRIQVIYKSGIHWSTADLQINAGEIVSIFLMDAAGLLTSIQPFAAAAQQIKTATVYYSGGQIQTDWINCAVLAFDHACCLSKIVDLHEQLASITSDSKPFQNLLEQFRKSDKPDSIKKPIDFSPFDSVRFIAFNDFPSTFGPLLRNMQNTIALHNSMQRNNNFFGNSKAETLSQYFLNRSQAQKSDPLLEKHWINLSESKTSYTHPNDFNHNVRPEQKLMHLKIKTVAYLRTLPAESGLRNTVMLGREITWTISDSKNSYKFFAFWAASKKQKKEKLLTTEETTPLIKQKSSDSCCSYTCCPIRCTLS